MDELKDLWLVNMWWWFFEKVNFFFPEIGDISGDFVSVSILATGLSIGDERGEKGCNDGKEWIDEGGVGRNWRLVSGGVAWVLVDSGDFRGRIAAFKAGS